MKTFCATLATMLILLLSCIVSSDEEHGKGLLLMTSYKWSGLTADQQELYIKSFLETVSFVMYSDAGRRDQYSQAFSDWTRCAETVPLKSSWFPFGWNIKGELNRNLAAQFLE